MKSCEFKTTGASVKAWFRTNNIIDKFLNIKDYPEFVVKNNKFSKHANNHYGVEGKMFTSAKGGTKAVPNEAMFRKIDSVKIARQKSNEKNALLQETINKNQAENIRDFTQSQKAAVGDDMEEFSKEQDVLNRYFNGNTQTKSVDVLNSISRSSHPLNKLAGKLSEYAYLNNVTIKLVDFIPTQGEILNPVGLYSLGTNEILINVNGKYKGSLEILILHEIIHSLTQRTIQGNSSTVKEFKKLMDHASKYFPAYDPLTNTGTYALYNLDEFIVALFTDSLFINELLKVPAIDNKKYLNLFEEVFDYIVGLFGIVKGDTLYSDAFAVATNILEDFKESTEAANSYNQLSFKLFSQDEYNKKPLEYIEEISVNKINHEFSDIIPEYVKPEINLDNLNQFSNFEKTCEL